DFGAEQPVETLGRAHHEEGEWPVQNDLGKYKQVPGEISCTLLHRNHNNARSMNGRRVAIAPSLSHLSSRESSATWETTLVVQNPRVASSIGSPAQEPKIRVW